MFEVELPYPPSINHSWRRVGPRTLISREGRRFRQRVMAILAARRVEPLHGPLAVEVEVYPPDNCRRDIDNVQKALLDALQHGGAYLDDSRIIDLHARKCAAAPAGKVRVRWRQVETTSMEIHDWVAVSKLGLVLGSFRDNQNEAGNAALQVLRLLGGPPLVAGFSLTQATLTIHDDDLPANRSRQTETG